MPNNYQLGDLVRCHATFSYVAEPIDPDEVRFRFFTPSGLVATYTFGTHAELVRESTGEYVCYISANEVGSWFYRFESRGNAQSASEKFFVVANSKFDTWV